MYYSLHYSWILLHPICKIRKTSSLSPAREKNEVFRIIDYMHEQEYATVSAFLYI